MTLPDPREALLREIRVVLADLIADGVTHVPHGRAPLPIGAARAQPQPVAAPSAPERTRPPATASPVAAERARPAPRPAPVAPRAEPIPPPPDPGSGERAAALAAIRADLGECQRCALCETRKTIVFGEGSPDAPVVFVGEGPGADEDRTGRPFVGKAGELLTRMIEAVGWQRSDVYICNIVKCRPPGNRDPNDAEVAACSPFLERQLLAIRPRVIIALGRPAASKLLGYPVAITRLRGQWQQWQGIAVMPTFHPAYLLRNYTRETRQAVWDDLRAARERASAEP